MTATESISNVSSDQKFDRHSLDAMDVFVGDDGTIYMILPQELRGPDRGCVCGDCKAFRANGGVPQTWNAVAVHPKSSHSWTVHVTPSSLRYALDNGLWRRGGRKETFRKSSK
jgi:hypothetical protein